MKYLKVWKQLSACAIGSYLSNRIDITSYFIGKLVRFGFFILLIVSIFNFTDSLAGYGKYEVLLFFLTFNLVDVFPQAFFRGIYSFREDVRKGNFDFALIKPLNPLFYIMTKLTDILDIIFLIPIIFLIIYTVIKLEITLTLVNILLYLIFIIVGQLIILGIHIISACVTIWTLESENFIWFYRESMTIGRFPPEILSLTVQFIFTFLMPIIIVVAFPVKILLGTLAIRWVLFALLYSFVFFFFSILLWRTSLKRYSSASS
ncbi:hypothetical protein DRH27_05520 [Candidatus Falkowbacteria bacterium]|nr:MAG: hypothetical protein DRH27_05520 [Candidatus Falkowbacteria bacterium]